MADPTQGVDWNANVPILDPSGNLRAIPQGMMQEALAQPGAKRAVPMLAPSGEHHWIPEDQLQLAVQSGGRISWPSQEIPKWFGFTPGNVASNFWQGAKGLVGGMYDLGADLVNNPNWFEGKNSTYEKFIGAPAEAQARQASELYRQRKYVQAGGHELAGAIPMVGPWAASLGTQAGTGDVGGAVGQAAGTVATGAALAKTPAALNRVIPSTTRAGAGLGLLTKWYGEHPIEPAGASSTIARFEAELAPTPSVKLPPILRDLQGRLLTTGPKGAEIVPGIEGQGPLTFAEARSFLKRINEARTRTGDIQDNALAATADALAQDIRAGVAKPSAVAPQGFAQDYNRMVGEYRHGQQLIRAGEEVAPVVGAGVGYELGRKAGQPVGGVMLGGMAGRILGRETLGRAARAVVERRGGAPNISAPPVAPTPPIPPNMPPTAYGRALIDAAAQKELLRSKGMFGPEEEIPTGEANRRIARMGGSVAVKPIVREPVARPSAPPAPSEPIFNRPSEYGPPRPGGPPAPENMGFNWAPAEDVGKKVRAQQPTLPRGERRAVTRPAGQVELEGFFRQARRELGENATTEQVMARVEELKKAARAKKPGPPVPPQ